MMRVLTSMIPVFFLLGCGGAPAPAPEAAPAPAAAPVRAPTATPAEAPAGPASQPAAPTTQAAAVLPNDGTRKVGDITRCPVSDEVFKVTETTPTAEHDGKTYYVCCGGCTRKFKSNPAQFLGAKTP